MKKGFTLVELLAVLVVLTIILAIAVPTIGNLIRNSTRNAFEIDAKMVLKAVDYKRIEDKKFDPLVVTKDNMMEQIGLDSSQYEQVTFKAKETETEMILVGAGKWDGLIAYGTIDNMHVVNSEDYDETPPSITILGDNPIEIGKGSTYTDAGATAFDLKDGDVPLTSTVIKNINGTVVGSVDTSTFTTYTITYTAVDKQGNIGSAARQVIIADKTAPVITILGSNPTSINVGSTYTDAGATALDDADGNVTSKIVVTGTVNPSVVGTYTITYTVKDNANNQAVAIRTVNVIDVTAPVITILGNNPASINVGGTYSDAGATALDDVDGDVTSEIVVTGTVNPSIVGSYTITYTVKDSNNNQAVATRTVYVVDNQAPTVAFSMNGNSTYAKIRNTTITVNDNVAVNTSSLKFQWTTSTTTPTEASFSISFNNGITINTPYGVTGGYYLWVLAKDTSNNTMIARSNAFNLDNTPPVITLNGNNPVNINVGSIYTDAGATASDNINGNITSSIVSGGSVNPSVIGTYYVLYNVSDSVGNPATTVIRTVNVLENISGPGYIASKGVNGPVLATGMTPIKWDGNSWIDTTTNDSQWYDYSTAGKKWANARTADGSMWVWIPRYIYKISSGWHTSSAGIINIQFSKGTNDNWNSSVIGNFNTDPTVNASMDSWTNHPAFTFGTYQLTGFWVPKFEASAPLTSACHSNSSSTNCNVANLAPVIIPNSSPWIEIKVGNIFTVSRNMEVNPIYGWGSSGAGIDTHMMKNVEWGAIAYLAQSSYGKNAEVWINPASNYITGCAGTSASSSLTSGCTNTYNTANGQQASTTGNIYGIYDMSGGASEYTAAYYWNSNWSTQSYDENISIINADPKYKDVYNIAEWSNDDMYVSACGKKGDAVCEISPRVYGSTSWYSDYSELNFFWYERGGVNSNTTSAGIFAFFSLYSSSGLNSFNVSFRPVLAVGAGL